MTIEEAIGKYDEAQNDLLAFRTAYFNEHSVEPTYEECLPLVRARFEAVRCIWLACK